MSIFFKAISLHIVSMSICKTHVHANEINHPILVHFCCSYRLGSLSSLFVSICYLNQLSGLNNHGATYSVLQDEWVLTELLQITRHAAIGSCKLGDVFFELWAHFSLSSLVVSQSDIAPFLHY